MTIRQRARIRVPFLGLSYVRNRVLRPGKKINVIRRFTNEDDLHWAFEIYHETWEVVNPDVMRVSQTWSNRLYSEKPPFELREEKINEYINFQYRTLIGVFYRDFFHQEGTSVNMYWEPTLPSRSKR